MTASTIIQLESAMTIPTMVLVRIPFASSFAPGLKGFATMRNPDHAIMIGAMKTMTIVMRKLMRLLMTIMNMPQPAAQTDCPPACGIMGPKNGTAACARCGRAREPSTSRSANGANRERIPVSYQHEDGLSPAFPPFAYLVSFRYGPIVSMVKRFSPKEVLLVRVQLGPQRNSILYNRDIIWLKK